MGVSRSLPKWNLKGSIGLQFIIFLDINLLAIQIDAKKNRNEHNDGDDTS